MPLNILRNGVYWDTV